MGLVNTRLDPAFFVLRKPGSTGGLRMALIVHVDDILVAHDGSSAAVELLTTLRRRYPFGDWKVAAEQPHGVTYCGRTIQITEVHGEKEAYIHQRPFTESRLETIELSAPRRRETEQLASALERSEYKSVLGSLQWLVSMTRPDLACAVNALQRRQAQPMVKHLLAVNDVVREALTTSAVGIRVRPIREPMVAVYGDSSLCNSAGEHIPDESLEQLEQAERDKVRSQVGVMVTIVDARQEDSVEPVRCSVVDWKSTSAKRVVYSTFAAETSAITVATGYGLFARSLLAEVMSGRSDAPPEKEEVRMPLRVLTDCKSLYDNTAKEGSVCECRWTAIYIASLREALSAGPGRDLAKAALRWVPSREQQADGLTKQGLSDRVRTLLSESVVRLHEESAQSLKRQASGNR